MSKMYEKIKTYYSTGLWNEIRVKNMVIKGIISKDEYVSIVGKEYEEQVCATLLLYFGNKRRFLFKN